MSIKNKTIKSISAFLIILVLGPSVLFSLPEKASAQTVDPVVSVWTHITSLFTGSSAVDDKTQLALKFKDIAKEVGQQVLMNIAKRALQEMTKSTVNWINSGFHGAPLFVENSQSFFKDIGKYEVKTFIDTIGYNSLKYPFGKGLALNTIDSYKRTFEDNAAYSLSKVTNDPALIDSFRNDFEVGGWNGFLLNTQYPQNNYVGFQLMANDELARRISGTVQNNAQKIQTTLEQGQGFLSPQTCPSNPEYNNLINQFKQPKFDEAKFYDDYEKTHPSPTSQDAESTAQWEKDRAAAYDAAWTAWSEENYCSGGLVDTTPGSVVGDQIKTALSSRVRSTELAGAMGNSVSAILDSLLNHFLGSGLNSLATKANPKPFDDEWSYNGQTLGSPTDGTNSAWDAGPDEEIILDVFKKQLSGKTIVTTTDSTGAKITKEEIGDTGHGQYIAGDIANTQAEITLLDNISAMHQLIWQKTKELDQCIPGPDRGWENRLNDEKDINASKLQEKSSDDDLNEAARARETSRELDYAAKFFGDWIKNKMLLALPNSVTYIAAVDNIDSIYQQSKETVEKKRIKIQGLARLKAIQTGLATMTTQPAPDSATEKVLIELKKQYNATQFAISNSVTVEDTRNDFNVLKENFSDLGNMTTECKTQRSENGWNTPDATGKGASKGVDKDERTGTEIDLFCKMPIIGGFSHGEITSASSGAFFGRFEKTTTSAMFRAITNPPKYGLELPMVNAKNVFTYDKAFGSGHVDININCSPIFKANILDYKGDIPGLTGPIGEIPLDDYETSGGDTGGGECTDKPDDGDTKHGNHSGEVAAAKSQLESEGANLSGACGAFAIINRAAKIIGGDAGILSKPSGNNCNGYATDIIFFTDGYAYDALIDGGGANNPTWSDVSCRPLDPGKYRSPTGDNPTLPAGPSCGQAGGNYCSPVPLSCPDGATSLGQTYDCQTCCVQ